MLVLTWTVEGEDIVHRYLILDILDYIGNTYSKSSLDTFLSGMLSLNKDLSLNITDTRPLTATYTGAGILPNISPLIALTETELAKQLVVLPYLNLSYMSNTDSVKAYQGTTLSFSTIGTIDTLTYNNLDALVIPSAFTVSIPTGTTKISFPSLKYIMGSYAFTFSTSGTTLTEIAVPELEYSDATFTIPAITSFLSMSLPKLKVGFISNLCTTLTDITFPEALQISYQDSVNSNINTVNLPKTKVLRNLILTGTKANLTSISLPSVEWIAAITMPTLSPALTSFTLNPGLKAFGSTSGNFVTSSNSLNQASVDSILVILASLDGTNGTSIFQARIVTITGGAATPSAIGLAAKAVLTARACTVTTN